MACPSYFIGHSPRTCDAPTYTKLEWLVHRILSFTVRAHATLRRIQNLNGLSIVFYRLHSAHTRRSDVYIDYRQVWDSLRLAPNMDPNHLLNNFYSFYMAAVVDISFNLTVPGSFKKVTLKFILRMDALVYLNFL